ncbi:MFS general substrate transporter [Xylona heveae TC161]|uniref:MFS general substrate transporter n=1 Tax=Xylona heveae (strain CBS 132557 / TC161) TaxID=1328760 RepID=A0A165HTR0_XYLHT|nr:MFS general substrate transporter [Xylona heveae TC161]KZF23920.1 MFS general substrate transporter [Xylona heveae TC161]
MSSTFKAFMPPYQLGARLGHKTNLGVILVTSTLVNFLDLFQLSSILFGLPEIEKALDFGVDEINWVLVAYNITFASFLLIAGQLGQRLGLEKIFMTGTAILTISNIINTAAPNKSALIVGRAISGIGAALTSIDLAIQAPNGLAIISRTFADGKGRSQALALYTACAPLGSVIGTVVGALLAASSAGWRSVFWVCLILSALALIVAALFLPAFSCENELSVDYIGVGIFTAGIALLVYGLNDSSRSGWRSAQVIVGLVLGGCLLLLFLWIETRVANPTVPRYLWKSGSFFLMLLVIFAFGGSFSAWFFISTQLCVNLLRYTSILTAVYFLPGAFSAIMTGGSSEPLVRLIGEKLTMMVGLAITGAGAVAWVYATPERAAGTGHHGGYWYAIVAAIIFVCASPVSMVPAQSVMLRPVREGDYAVASALFNAAYQVGASVLLAGANTIMGSETTQVKGPNGMPIEMIDMDGYQGAFWLLAGVLFAATAIVGVSYWPKSEKKSEQESLEEAIPETIQPDEKGSVPPNHQSERDVAIP